MQDQEFHMYVPSYQRNAVRLTSCVVAQQGRTAFWTRHCFAVSLGKGNKVEGVGPVKQVSMVALCSVEVVLTTALFVRHRVHQPQTCSRCGQIKTPNGKGGQGNHARDYCLDGFPTKLDKAKYSKMPVAPWPQPEGVYVKGKTFNAVAFLHTVRRLYEVVVIDNNSDAVSMEHHAFAMVLSTRVVHKDGVPCFKLYPSLTLSSSTPGGLVFDDKGGDGPLLRLEYLKESDYIVSEPP